MGKRSDFERIDKDFYRTIDPKAGKALSPFLEDKSLTVLEPFAGAGDLVTNIIHPRYTWFMSDIEPQAPGIYQNDAFDLIPFDDIVITNPPWTRSIFHHAIEYFTPKVKYCWWLMDANWQFTKQAIPYMNEYVTDIVTIGRLRWIPDTTMSGKDDCVWIRTSSDKSEKFVRFYGRSE